MDGCRVGRGNEVAWRYVGERGGEAGSPENVGGAGGAGFSLSSRVGEWFVPGDVPAACLDAWQQLRIPLPSGRKSDWPDGTDAVLDVVLEELFQMQRHQLRLSYPRDVFFARGGRELLLRPSSVTSEVAVDETQTAGTAADTCLRLQFSLPASQYATMFVKVLEAMAGIAW